MENKQTKIKELPYNVPQIELLDIEVEAGFSSSEEIETSMTGGDAGELNSGRI